MTPFGINNNMGQYHDDIAVYGVERERHFEFDILISAYTDEPKRQGEIQALTDALARVKPS